MCLFILRHYWARLKPGSRAAAGAKSGAMCDADTTSEGLVFHMIVLASELQCLLWRAADKTLVLTSPVIAEKW